MFQVLSVKVKEYKKECLNTYKMKINRAVSSNWNANNWGEEILDPPRAEGGTICSWRV
jgi:hypothetical protein